MSDEKKVFVAEIADEVIHRLAETARINQEARDEIIRIEKAYSFFTICGGCIGGIICMLVGTRFDKRFATINHDVKPLLPSSNTDFTFATSGAITGAIISGFLGYTFTKKYVK